MPELVTYFELADKPFFYGMGALLVPLFFIFWSVIVLIIKALDDGEDKERTARINSFRRISILFLFVSPFVIYMMVKANIDSRNASKSSDVHTTEGYITNYTGFKKDAWFEFEVNGIAFKTGDGYIECRYTNCGLHEGLYVKLFYQKKKFKNIIVKIDLLPADYKVLSEQYKLAQKLCFNEGICRNANKSLKQDK